MVTFVEPEAATFRLQGKGGEDLKHTDNSYIKSLREQEKAFKRERENNWLTKKIL